MSPLPRPDLRVARALLVAPLLVLGAACEHAPAAPVDAAADAPLASAVSNTIHRDFAIDDFASCNGDVLSGTATEHIVVREASDGAGGFHINFKYQLNNMHLTGSPSGASYVGTLMESTNFYLAPSEVLSGVVIRSFRLNVFGQGQTPNFLLEGILRIVISANGIERVYTETFTAVCH